MYLRPHRRKFATRVLAAIFVMSALLLGVRATQSVPARTDTRVNVATRFDHIAVFGAGTPNAVIDTWRSSVLGRVHKESCADDRPCLRRLMRISRSGDEALEMLAFDLDPHTPDVERTAILAAALQTEPLLLLREAIRPQQVSIN